MHIQPSKFESLLSYTMSSFTRAKRISMTLRSIEFEAQPSAVSKGAATRRLLGTGLACQGLV
jgi:hypothetical protein